MFRTRTGVSSLGRALLPGPGGVPEIGLRQQLLQAGDHRPVGARRRFGRSFSVSIFTA